MSFHNLQYKKKTFCWLAILIAVVQTITIYGEYLLINADLLLLIVGNQEGSSDIHRDVKYQQIRDKAQVFETIPLYYFT